MNPQQIHVEVNSTRAEVAGLAARRADAEALRREALTVEAKFYSASAVRQFTEEVARLDASINERQARVDALLARLPSEAEVANGRKALKQHEARAASARQDARKAADELARLIQEQLTGLVTRLESARRQAREAYGEASDLALRLGLEGQVDEDVVDEPTARLIYLFSAAMRDAAYGEVGGTVQRDLDAALTAMTEAACVPAQSA